MEDKELVGQMLKMASDLSTPETTQEEPVVAELTKRPVALIQADYKECSAIVAGTSGARTAADPRIDIEDLPGFSKSQVKLLINKVVEARQEAEILKAQYDSVIKKLKNLDKEEKKNVALLRKASEQVAVKTRYLVTAEKGMLEFTAYMTAKRPGVIQLIDRDAKLTPGGKVEKAGQMLDIIAAELGQDVGDAVERIYHETMEDLTHMAQAVNGFKVVVKNASLSREIKASVLKEAGISDVVTDVLDWLGGNASRLKTRVMSFTGDILKWAKGFVTRSVIVKNEAAKLTAAMDSAMTQIDQIVPD